MAQEPLVHVLVINWNGREHLAECFETLLAGTYDRARFVLIDNGSTDGSVAFVRGAFRGPRVEVVECGRNLGWSGGNNVGIRRALAAGADYVFLLNNDTATAPDAVERLVVQADAMPQTAALAPKMLLYSQPHLLNSLGMECSIIGCGWDRGLGRLDDARWDTSCPVPGVCGGAAFLRAEALRETGLLAEEFGIYLDDLDLCLRFWDAGYEVWTCPGARVRHKFSATMGEGRRARRKYYLTTRNRFWLLLRNYPAGKLAMALPSVLRGESKALGRAVLEGEYWRLGCHAQAWGAAVGYLPKALRERRRRVTTREGCRFWPMVRRDVLFYGGVELPDAGGWYAPRLWEGREMRPMGRSARVEAPGERLRVWLANCYPQCGGASVFVGQDERVLACLQAPPTCAVDLDAAPGALWFSAERVFAAEDTGAAIDVGGWLAVEVLDDSATRSPRHRTGTG